MLRNHLLPKMRLADLHTVKGFSESHLPQNIKCQHLIPNRHIQPLSRPFHPLRRLQPRNESIDTGLNNILLFGERFGGERGREEALHLRVPGWISLAADTAAVESGAEDIIEVAFYKRRLAWPGSVDCFPGFDGGKREFIGGDAEDGACGYSVLYPATVPGRGRGMDFVEYRIFGAPSRLNNGSGRSWSV